MSRLIDADKLIEILSKNSIFRTVTNAEGKSVIEIIEEQTTAFNVDKVIRQLEEEKNCLENEFMNGEERVFGAMMAYKNTIDIVRAGGMND